MGKRYFYFETSRGCPYGCEYCLSSTDRKVRYFSEAYVFNILEKLKDSDVKVVKLLDRTFNVKPSRALKMARYMNEQCTKQIFQFEVVAETLSDEMLDFFIYEADKKRFRLEIGVQSFHEKTLEAVGRYQNNKRLMEVIKKLKDIKAKVKSDNVETIKSEASKMEIAFRYFPIIRPLAICFNCADVFFLTETNECSIM